VKRTPLNGAMGRFWDDPRTIAKADGPRARGYRSIALAAYRVFLFSSSTKAVPYFGAIEATIFSKRGSPRSGSQNGRRFN
jgi:hypothetical protein